MIWLLFVVVFVAVIIHDASGRKVGNRLWYRCRERERLNTSYVQYTHTRKNCVIPLRYYSLLIFMLNRIERKTHNYRLYHTPACSIGVNLYGKYFVRPTTVLCVMKKKTTCIIYQIVLMKTFDTSRRSNIHIEPIIVSVGSSHCYFYQFTAMLTSMQYQQPIMKAMPIIALRPTQANTRHVHCKQTHASNAKKK